MCGTEMAQPKDPAIMLFGRKIPVTDTQMPASSLSKGSCSEVTKDQQDNDSSDQEKVLKKLDKIVPCPRCNSMETKFCYFNNYNVNQLRHFCRNCQRYWTAGGTMRNVPVGARRRKNKHFPSQFRELLASTDGIPVTRVEHSDPATHQLVTPADATSSFTTSTGNGVVLKFGAEATLCTSMGTVLNIGDQKKYVDACSAGLYDNAEEPSSSGSSITAGSNRANEAPEDATRQENVSLPKSSEDQSSLHLHPMQLHSLVPVVFPWNPLWNNSAAVAASKCSTEQAPIPNANGPNQALWSPAQVLAVQGFCSPSIPLHFIPASYWGSMPVLAAGTRNMSLFGSNGCPSPSSSTSISCCTPNGPPTLGKHHRDSTLSEEEKPEKCLFAPKTHRIDQSNEASKSPGWDALGLKPDRKDAMPNGNCI